MAAPTLADVLLIIAHRSTCFREDAAKDLAAGNLARAVKCGYYAEALDALWRDLHDRMDA